MLLCVLIAAIPSDAQTPSYQFSSRTDSAWTALFHRKTPGWTGADGIFAIPLSGTEAPGGSPPKTLFIFSDTFIGRVNAQTGARTNANMIHNSMAVLTGNQPDSSNIRFLWAGTLGAPRPFFVPSTPRGTASTGSWYWLQDGFRHGGNVYLFTILVVQDPSGDPGFQFKENGVTLIKIPLDTNGEPNVAAHTQRDVPLFHRSGNTTLFFGGAGVLPNTVEAGAPSPDGYLYVYGRLQFGLAVARILPAQIEDTTAWTYWNGSAWSANIATAASVGDGGAELSVTPIPNGPLAGKYLMCSAPLNGDVFVQVGNTPVGPFGARKNVYHPTETNTALGIYTYNAKIHPSLSPSGSELLLSYNVNTTNWDANLAEASIYRPRFVRLTVAPTGTSIRSNAMENTGHLPLHPGSFKHEGRNAIGRKVSPIKPE
jgi:hypothetical protein